jgi:5S rRNA maturation endonuclease (ribonuclease M5)
MVVAPYYDVFGRLAGARGRSILPDPTKKHHDYSFNGHNNCRMVWYNEQVLNLPGPVVVVEGQFDCWRVSTVYPKVVANLTAKPSDEKFKKLCDSQEVIQIPDNDDAGDGSIATYSKLAKKYGIKHRVVTLDHSVKDPAECHPSYLKGILS